MKEHYCVTKLLMHGTHTSKKGDTNKTVYKIHFDVKKKKKKINR